MQAQTQAPLFVSRTVLNVIHHPMITIKAYLHRLNNPWRHTEDVIWGGLSIERRSSESSHKSGQPTCVNALYCP